MPEFTVIVTRAGTVKIKDAKTSEEAMEKAQALSAGDIQWDDDFIATDVSGVRLSSGEDIRTALAGCDGFTCGSCGRQLKSTDRVAACSDCGMLFCENCIDELANHQCGD